MSAVPTNFVDNTGMAVNAAYLNNLGAEVNNNTAALARTPAAAFVATSENVASATYADLTTTTDQVTVTIGPSGKALVTVSARPAYAGGTGVLVLVGFAISGATTRAASDDYAVEGMGPYQDLPRTLSGTFVVTGLTPGSNTFKMKYKTAAGSTYAFSRRHIGVLPL